MGGGRKEGGESGDRERDVTGRGGRGSRGRVKKNESWEGMDGEGGRKKRKVGEEKMADSLFSILNPLDLRLFLTFGPTPHFADKRGVVHCYFRT